MVCGIFSGCSNRKEETYSEDTLNVWADMINGDEKKYNEIAEKWSESHGGMKVNIIQNDAKASEFIENSLKPDIVLGMSTEETEKLELSGTADEVPQDLFKDDEFVSEDLLHSVTIKGKRYGVPFSQNSVVLFYNKDKVDTVANTLEDVFAKAEDVGFTTVIDDKFYNYGMLSAFGGYFYKYNNGVYDDQDIGTDSEGAIKGFQFISDIVNKHKFCIAGTTDLMASHNFETGECGYYIGEYGRIRTFINDNINFGVSKIPTLNSKEFTPLKRTYMSIVNKDSSKKDLAWDFIRYFMDEASEYIMTSNPKAPVLKKTLETDSFKNTDYLKEIYNQSLVAEPLPNIISGAAYLTAIDYNISSLTLKQIDAKECGNCIKKDLIEARDIASPDTKNIKK